MLTPSFKLTQDCDYLYVEIRAPHTNVRDTEITYEGRTFLFSSRPYFLRLHLPADVQPMDAERVMAGAPTDDDGDGGVQGKADYDCDQGLFSIRVPKRCRGEHFPNLDMLSELLKPPASTRHSQQRGGAREGVSARPLVEMLPEEDDVGEDGIDTDELYAKQQLPTTSVKEESAARDGACERFGYGFAWRRHGVLANFRDEIGDLLELRDADATPIDRRVKACWLFVAGNFNPDHYLADLFEPPDELSECLAAFSLNRHAHLSLTDADRAQLKDLRVRELPRLDAATRYSATLTLLDLLLAYAYDVRTTMGEASVESGWTVAKLCSSLQFLVKWDGSGDGGGVRQVLVAFIRRALSFPLYRHWQLAMAVIGDVQRVLAEGRPAILHCLLQVRSMFNSSGGDFRYLFNQLYVDDYCLWVQSTSGFPDELLSTMREELNDTMMTTTIGGTSEGGIGKADVGLDLDTVEARARLQLMEMDNGGDEEVDVIQLE